ncbi:MAG: class I SAM-dependent methyltransferase [Caldilineaceae bacterium]
MSNVQAFYDQNSEAEWARLDQHRTEFAVTMRALHEFLPAAPASILDIGGGPGRYAIALAQESYSVTLADLSKANLDLARERAGLAGIELVGYRQINALDLSSFANKCFDAVLLMGPLYHLLAEQERAQAVAEATRVLKPGGTLFASFITRFAFIRDSAQGYPEWLVENWAYANQILQTGAHDPDDGAKGFTQAYFAYPAEVEPLMAAAGLQPLVLIGCEGIVAGHEARVNTLAGEAWERWVDLNYRLGKDPTLHGAADHLLYVGRKVVS